MINHNARPSAAASKYSARVLEAESSLCPSGLIGRLVAELKALLLLLLLFEESAMQAISAGSGLISLRLAWEVGLVEPFDTVEAGWLIMLSPPPFAPPPICSKGVSEPPSLPPFSCTWRLCFARAFWNHTCNVDRWNQCNMTPTFYTQQKSRVNRFIQNIGWTIPLSLYVEHSISVSLVDVSKNERLLIVWGLDLQTSSLSSRNMCIFVLTSQIRNQASFPSLPVSPSLAVINSIRRCSS